MKKAIPWMFGVAWALLATAAFGQQAAMALPGQPPFDWDSSFASPGTSLQIRQVPVFSGRSGEGLSSLCTLTASGFPEGEKLLLWQRIQTAAGPLTTRLPITLGPGGVVLINGQDKMMITGFARGQALDMAVATEAGSTRAHAKVYLDPIEAKSAKGCGATVETVSETARDFVLWLSGFPPGAEIHVTQRLKRDTRSSVVKAPDHGQASLPLNFPKDARGKASVTASGGGCAVTVELGVGDLSRI